MKRIGYVIAAVLAVALAALVLPRGGDPIPSPAADERAADAPDAAVDRDAPPRERLRKRFARVSSDEPPTEGTPEYDEALLHGRSPVGRAAATTQSAWTQVARELAAVGTPDALEFAGEAEAMIDELRELRRDPAVMEWHGVEARQAELAQRIRTSGVANEAIERSLQLMEQRIAEYHMAEPPQMVPVEEQKDLVGPPDVEIDPYDEPPPQE